MCSDYSIAWLDTVGILAGKFHSLSTVSFIVCFAFLQFFFNFGANATTYVRPITLNSNIVSQC